MTSSSLRKNTQHTNLYGADLSDAALGRYDEPPWRLLRSGGLSVCPSGMFAQEVGCKAGGEGPLLQAAVRSVSL